MQELPKQGVILFNWITNRYAFGQTIDDYQHGMDVNYTGVVNTLFCTVPEMIKRNQVIFPSFFYIGRSVFGW